VTVARSSSDSNTTSYVFPVLWVTSCFHIMEEIGPNHSRRVYFVQVAKWRHLGRSLPYSCVSAWYSSANAESSQVISGTPLKNVVVNDVNFSKRKAENILYFNKNHLTFAILFKGNVLRIFVNKVINEYKRYVTTITLTVFVNWIWFI